MKRTSYVLGHDQITQTVTEAGVTATHTFHADGHGSVRVLTAAAAAVLQTYVYDAYGLLLNIEAEAALTSYLYSGEAFDTTIGQQNLRARWYNPRTGGFNRLDPFFGNHSDPQSFHKYLYTHADPVNGVDPTGLSLTLTITARIGIAAGLVSTGVPVALYALGAYGNAVSSLERRSAKGLGGQNITNELLDGVDRLQMEFNARPLAEQKSLFASAHGLSAWDIFKLSSNPESQRQAFARNNDERITNWAPRSVTVGYGTDAEVHYAHEVNYFLWGVIYGLAHDAGIVQTTPGIPAVFGKPVNLFDAKNYAIAYRPIGAAYYVSYEGRLHDGTLHGRLAWVEAGYDYVRSRNNGIPQDIALQLPSKFALPAEANLSTYTKKLSPRIGTGASREVF